MAVSATPFVALKCSSTSAPRCLFPSVSIRTCVPFFPFRPLKFDRILARRRFLATSASPRQPPSQPSSGKDLNIFSGLQNMLSRAEAGLHIFFAVLFWMSLFFWGSAWDGREDDKKKGPQIRK